MLPHTLLAALRQAPIIVRGHDVPIFLQGERPLGLWMVESGELCISRANRRGRSSAVLGVLEAGDLAGLAAIMADAPHETEARTCGTCSLRLLLRADFLHVFHDDSSIGTAVAFLLAAELTATYRWIGTTTHPGSVRLARFVLDSTRPELARLTHTELARRVGLSRETVSRLVRDLRKSGALEGESMHVRDRTVLEGIAK